MLNIHVMPSLLAPSWSASHVFFAMEVLLILCRVYFLSFMQRKFFEPCMSCLKPPVVCYLFYVILWLHICCCVSCRPTDIECSNPSYNEQGLTPVVGLPVPTKELIVLCSLLLPWRRQHPPQTTPPKKHKIRSPVLLCYLFTTSTGVRIVYRDS
jgi:hypothetical protein